MLTEEQLQDIERDIGIVSGAGRVVRLVVGTLIAEVRRLKAENKKLENGIKWGRRIQ